LKPFFLFFFLIFFIISVSAFAQETEIESDSTVVNEETEVTELYENLYDDESVFVINSFKYNVKGITLPFMLNTKTELKAGEEIKGKKNLEAFIQDKKQLLINERVLSDDVVIEYSIGEKDEEDKFPVDLAIFVEDTWNIIALPYPKYDSNYGFELTIKARDYNFFGTMNPLRVDLGYKYNQEGRSFFNLMVDSGIPFEAFGLKWHFDFDNYLDYRPDVELPWYYKNRTAISVDIPIKRTTLNLWFSESFIVNEENSEKDKLLYGQRFQEGLYMSSNPNITWKIPTGLEVGNYGELTYTPSIYAVFNHEFPDWPLQENRKGTYFYFTHNLYFGRIDWKGNFREGISLRLDNSFSFSVYNFENKTDDPWGYSYSARAIGHFIFIEDRLGLSSRLYLRHWINDYSEYAGNTLRGVYDRVRYENLYPELMFSVNLDLQFRILRLLPSTWFPGSDFWRIFDLDLHINPIIDFAWFKPYKIEPSFSADFFLLGAGIDTIIFPHRFRSLYFRISTAWNLSNISKKAPDIIKDLELLLEMGFHY